MIVDIVKTIINKIDIKTLLILILVLIIFFMRSCSEENEKNDREKIKINGQSYTVLKNEKDTVYHEVVQIEYRPGSIIYKEKIKYDTIPMEVDTMEILKEYYSKYVYIDTLVLNDSLGYITVTDTITNNKILGRLWDSKVNKITITDVIYLEKDKTNQLFIGGVIGADNVNLVNFIGPSVVFKNKKEQLYSFGAGFSNNRTISIQGGMYWKIKLKKDKK